MRVRGLTCVYCGEPAASEDHVVAECLLLDPSKAVLVPACQKCNGTKSREDEFLRDMFAMRQEISRMPELLDLRAASERAMLRKEFRGPARKMIETFAYRTVTIGGTEHEVPTVEAEGGRANEAFKWMVRGLFFHHKRQMLDADHEFQAWYYNGPDNKSAFDVFWPDASNGPYHIGNCLSYKVTIVPEIDYMHWLFVFYGRLLIRVTVNEHKLEEEAANRGLI